MKEIIFCFISVFCFTVAGFAADNNFSGVDRDKNGKISKKEYRDAVKKTFDKLDKNKDGLLSREELDKIDKLDMKRFVQETDKNSDGKISREEFRGAAEKRFKFLDKDNSGYIDQKEWNEGLNPRNSKTAPVSPLFVFTF